MQVRVNVHIYHENWNIYLIIQYNLVPFLKFICIEFNFDVNFHWKGRIPTENFLQITFLYSPVLI